MKFTLQVTTVEQVEIDAEFPIYRKSSGGMFYKVINENDGLMITYAPDGILFNNMCIKKVPAYFAWDKNMNTKESTEQEFNEALELSINYFKNF